VKASPNGSPSIQKPSHIDPFFLLGRMGYSAFRIEMSFFLSIGQFFIQLV
jgi:hypothetical protein